MPPKPIHQNAEGLLGAAILVSVGGLFLFFAFRDQSSGPAVVLLAASGGGLEAAALLFAFCAGRLCQTEDVLRLEELEEEELEDE